MLVECVGNSALHLVDESDVEAFSEYVHQEEVHLSIGQSYLVFGVFLRRGSPWFLVCEAEDASYPKPHFGKLFRLLDGRVPPNWSLRLNGGNVGDFALLPDPWAADSSFLEKLVDGLPEAVDTFEELKRTLRESHKE